MKAEKTAIPVVNEPGKDPHTPGQGDKLWASYRRLKAQVADLTAEISVLRRDYSRLTKQYYRENKDKPPPSDNHQKEEKIPAGIFGE